MRLLIISLILAVTAGAQTPPKMITFNQADKEHCKVVQANGKAYLESTYEGTSVAITMPVNRGNGEFAVFVAIYRADRGSIEVNPKDIYGVFSDAAHSRFGFYDASGETHGPSAEGSLSANQQHIDPGSLRPGAQLGGGSSASGPMPSGDASGGQPAARSAAPTYLRETKLKQGEKVAGWVALRPAKDTTVEVKPGDMLDEVNIPVNGVVFRF